MYSYVMFLNSLMRHFNVVKVGPNEIDVKIAELQRCKLQIGERHAAEFTSNGLFFWCCMVLSLTHPPKISQDAEDQRSNAVNHRKTCQTTIPGLTRRLALGDEKDEMSLHCRDHHTIT